MACSAWRGWCALGVRSLPRSRTGMGIRVVAERGVFGEFVATHYSITYPLAWAGGLITLGLILLKVFKDRVDVE